MVCELYLYLKSQFFDIININQMYKLTKILLRSFSDKNFTGGYFWVKL